MSEHEIPCVRKKGMERDWCGAHACSVWTCLERFRPQYVAAMEEAGRRTRELEMACAHQMKVVERNAALVAALKEALGCTPHCDGPCKHHTHVAASVIQKALAAEEKAGA